MPIKKTHKPKNSPPPVENADKVLKELKEQTAEIFDKYQERLESLHAMFKKEPLLSRGSLNEIMASLNETSGELMRLRKRNIVVKAFSTALRKIVPGLRSLDKEMRLVLKMNHQLMSYLQSLTTSLADYDVYKAAFHTELLKYTQQIGPYTYYLQSEVARQVTAFPVERMDIVFFDLMRQMDQLRVDMERMRAKIESFESADRKK